MVIDRIENVLFCKPMIPALEAGVTVVKIVEELEPGKYRSDGGYFNIQKSETKPMNKGTFEAYRRRIDVQILAKKCEEVAWADVGDLKTMISYDRRKDAGRSSGDTKNHICVDQGMFYIALPHDGHKPVSHTDESHSFTRIIIKVPAPERAQAYSGGQNGGSYGKRV